VVYRAPSPGRRFAYLAAPLELAKYGADLVAVLLTVLAAKRPKSPLVNGFCSARVDRGNSVRLCCYFNDLARTALQFADSIYRPTEVNPLITYRAGDSDRTRLPRRSCRGYARLRVRVTRRRAA
jgi:hypothetical protein